MRDLANRHIAPNVRLPIVPPPGTGIVTDSCEDRTPYPVAAHVGRMLRIGGEVRLCFDCGPDGGVYHPAGDDLMLYNMEEVRRAAERIFLKDGDGSEPPTAAELKAFDVEMRRAFGIEP